MRLFLFFYLSIASGYTRPIPFPPGELDTRQPPSETETFIYRQVFDTLFVSTKSGVQGSLASRWKFENGGKVLQIHLVETKFHSGKSLTNSDVKYSIERLKNSGDYIGTLLESIEKIELGRDPLELKILFKRPVYNFTTRLTDPAISIIAKDENSSALNGTGPFKLKSSTKDLIAFQKNSNYFSTPARIENLLLPVIKKPDAINLFKNGKVDDLFHYYLNPEERNSMKEYCAWSFEILPALRFMVVKSYTNEGLRNRNSRKCVVDALNRQTIVDDLDKGQKLLVTSLPMHIYGGKWLKKISEVTTCSDLELESLRTALRQNPLRVAGVEGHEALTSSLMKMLKKKELTAQLIIFPSTPEFLRGLRSDNIDLYIARYTARSAEVESFEKAFVGEHSYWKVEKDQDLYSKEKAIEKMESRGRRAEEYAKLFNLLVDRKYFVPLNQYEFNGCYRKKIKNMSIEMNGFIYQDMRSIEEP